jgi:hypothetical protein
VQLLDCYRPKDVTVKRYFCTLFDQGYLLKGVAMLESLKRNCANAHVYVLAMDEQAGPIIGKLGYDWVTCIPLAAIETPEILEAKKTRGYAEYCWTLSPCLPSYILDTNPQIDLITYLDADLYFYSPVEPIFDEIAGSSIAIIEHRFAPRMKEREINGRFCVEWVSIRRDEEGLRCLSRWRGQCIEWCYYRLEEGRMGDQKYLDEWPSLYPDCHIIGHAGAGLAPWNFEAHTFAADQGGNILVDGKPLIFYHFHQLQMLDNMRFNRLSDYYRVLTREPEIVYAPYEQALAGTLKRIRVLAPGFSAGLKSARKVALRRFAQRSLPFGVKDFFRKFFRY